MFRLRLCLTGKYGDDFLICSYYRFDILHTYHLGIFIRRKMPDDERPISFMPFLPGLYIVVAAILLFCFY
jgi:hypothetical protein